MAVISIKCSDQEKEAFQKHCDKQGVTVSGALRALMNQAAGNTPKRVSISDLLERVRALEAKYESLSDRPGTYTPPTPYKTGSAATPTDSDTLPDLITIEQAAALTGYAKATLSSKLSREGVQVVERINGNRGGLYSKAEILQRIGRK